jgi:hypothetical protein
MIKAASLYNLGRIEEQRGNLEEARKRYRDSLALRPHKGVEARLRALDGAQNSGKMQPRPLLGPFQTLSDYCDQYVPAPGVPEPEGVQCDPQPLQSVADRARHVSAQIFEVRTWLSPPGEEEESYLATCQLGVKSGGKWYVLADLFECGKGKVAVTGIGAIALRKLEVEPGLVLEVDVEQHIARDGQSSEEKRKLVCGIGESGRPSCTPPLAPDFELTFQQGIRIREPAAAGSEPAVHEIHFR